MRFSAVNIQCICNKSEITSTGLNLIQCFCGKYVLVEKEAVQIPINIIDRNLWFFSWYTCQQLHILSEILTRVEEIDSYVIFVFPMP